MRSVAFCTRHGPVAAGVCDTSDMQHESGHDPVRIERALQGDPVEATLTTSRALLGLVARSLSETLDLVTLPQFRVLVILAGNGPMRIGELAKRVRSVPSTFTRSMDRMEQQGWVVREASPTSRREVLVHLTPKGAQLVAEVTDRRRSEISEVLRRLTPEDAEIVARAFAVFAAAAAEPPPEDLVLLGL